jgi:hypothetical protein
MKDGIKLVIAIIFIYLLGQEEEMNNFIDFIGFCFSFAASFGFICLLFYMHAGYCKKHELKNKLNGK